MKKCFFALVLMISLSAMIFGQTPVVKYIGAPGTGPNGTNPDYASLQAACDAANAMTTFTGDVTFYITSDLTETDGIGLAVDPSPYHIYFRPFKGKTIKVTFNGQADDNSGPSGAWVIGITNQNNIAWADMKPTKNIIIDGRYSDTETERSLTLESATTAYRNSIPIIITGTSQDITIRYCNVYHKSQVENTNTAGELFNAAIFVRARVQDGADKTPKNIVITNNHLSGNWPATIQKKSGLVFGYSGTAVTTLMDGCVVKNNIIEGKQNALVLNLVKNILVEGNEFIVNQDIAAKLRNQAINAVKIDPAATVTIANNKFTRISSLNTTDTTGKPGNAAIRINSAGNYEIYNNMITGFNLQDSVATPATYLTGVEVNNANAAVNLYHNTLYMNNPGFMAGMSNYRGYNLLAGKITYKNNILASTNKCRPGAKGVMMFWNTAATLTADYNIYWIDNFAFFENMDFAIKVNGASWTYFGAIGEWWGTKTDGFEDNSEQKNPDFVSATDLHLKPAGASAGSPYFKGTLIEGINKDIDGEYRSTIPYIGADEDPAHYFGTPLPVELTSFTASLSDGKVVLNWATATETNNSGFEIQRSYGEVWQSVGFIKGAGSTTEKRSYTFEDKNVNSSNAKISYRLKQVDFNGTVSYSNSVEVALAPSKFALNQNYPNPFNPSTTISFTLPVNSRVTLKVFDMLGKEVATLVSSELASGVHSYKLDASHLTSGTYIYRMEADGISGQKYVSAKKMMLVK